MPRKKVKHIRLAGRVSENNMTPEEINFIEEQLKDISKSELIRQALRIYYKHQTGQYFKEVLKTLEDYGIKINKDNREKMVEDDDMYKKVKEKVKSGFIKKKK